MKGRSLDNPTRGNPAWLARASTTGRKDRNASGKSARRSGGSCATGITVRRADRSKSPRGPRRGNAPNGRGGQRRTAREPRLRSDSSPRRRHLTVRWRGADHAPVPCEAAPDGNPIRRAARTRRNTVQRRIAHAAHPRAPRREREAVPKGPPAPEDHANHIPVRLPSRARKVAARGRLRPPARCSSSRAGRTDPSANL
jgi:hypothetical protein